MRSTDVVTVAEVEPAAADACGADVVPAADAAAAVADNITDGA